MSDDEIEANNANERLPDGSLRLLDVAEFTYFAGEIRRVRTDGRPLFIQRCSSRLGEVYVQQEPIRLVPMALSITDERGAQEIRVHSDSVGRTQIAMAIHALNALVATFALVTED